ncbi:MAG: CsbD family protein [Myxococcales bacterium]|nr:CsbD family protein [Myxococcales bacterium]MCB9581800.1 CsbD family protein [Polyangiaceae bacterium]
MNRDIIEGRWNELKGQIKGQWAKLTDDDIQRANGKTEELVGVLQQRYGYEKEEAKKQVERFADSVKQRIDGKN